MLWKYKSDEQYPTLISDCANELIEKSPRATTIKKIFFITNKISFNTYPFANTLP